MPNSSMSRIQLNQMLESRTPAAEVVWVRGHLDGQTSIPHSEVACTRRWKRSRMRESTLKQTATDIVDVAELAEPLSYTLRTLGMPRILVRPF